MGPVKQDHGGRCTGSIVGCQQRLGSTVSGWGRQDRVGAERALCKRPGFGCRLAAGGSLPGRQSPQHRAATVVASYCKVSDVCSCGRFLAPSREVKGVWTQGLRQVGCGFVCLHAPSVHLRRWRGFQRELGRSVHRACARACPPVAGGRVEGQKRGGWGNVARNVHCVWREMPQAVAAGCLHGRGRAGAWRGQLHGGLRRFTWNSGRSYASRLMIRSRSSWL